MTIQLPNDPILLEEANFPEDLAQSLAGLTIDVRIVPEELPCTRQVDPKVEPKGRSYLIARDGTTWNDYRPLQVSFTDLLGKSWQIPRRWLREVAKSVEPDSNYTVTQSFEFRESLHLPTYWDLLEINVPNQEANSAAGQQVQVLVRIAPGGPVKVIWQDSQGVEWRIPHNWRRRRVRLPDSNKLIAQGIPRQVAEDFATQIVSVNYHPGSLCCLPDQYRFRDQKGNRYPVYIKDCVLTGYGDAVEHCA